MKRGVVCNIPVTEGEITIVKAETAGEIMKHSCEVAMASRSAGAGVLVINTGLSKRRFKEAATGAGIEWSDTRNTDTIVSPGAVPLIIQTSVAGRLSKEMPSIKTICEEANIKIVVVTAWEWTSSSYALKEQLLFGLRQLLDDLDVAVIVYTQSSGDIMVGKYARGGVGKLAMIAYEVTSLEFLRDNMDEVVTDLSAFVERVTSSVVEQLVVNKIKELQPVFVSGVSAIPLKHQRTDERVLALAA
ncbi:MAG TPA: hypothetical protein VFO76_10515 [Candidatus Kapabacteria bacterium]|nr:hypothetical protein [Candidatus Kapabacteria bacterium]